MPNFKTVSYDKVYDRSLEALKALAPVAEKAKVAIFNSGIDVALTETKGTVLIKNANDMLNYEWRGGLGKGFGTKFRTWRANND